MSRTTIFVAMDDTDVKTKDLVRRLGLDEYTAHVFVAKNDEYKQMGGEERARRRAKSATLAYPDYEFVIGVDRELKDGKSITRAVVLGKGEETDFLVCLTHKPPNVENEDPWVTDVAHAVHAVMWVVSEIA